MVPAAARLQLCRHVLYVEGSTLMCRDHHPLARYVVLTSLHFSRSYRQNDDNVAMWDAVRNGGLPYRAFTFRGDFPNKGLYHRLDLMFEGYFISPTIEVYCREG